MFQALNATGTPITALETFLPQVMQAERSNSLEWNEAPSRASFVDIDDLFESITSNVRKLVVQTNCCVRLLLCTVRTG